MILQIGIDDRGRSRHTEKVGPHKRSWQQTPDHIELKIDTKRGTGRRERAAE